MGLLDTFFEAVRQPIAPAEIGLFDFEIFGVWIIAGLGLLTQLAADPRSKRAKNFRVLLMMFFSLLIFIGAAKVVLFMLEV